MATILSILAILISLSSLGFSIYQNRGLQRLKKYEKANTIVRHSLELRKKSQDLTNRIECTDHVPDCPEFINVFNRLVESDIIDLASKETISLSELYKLEKQLLKMELDIDLFIKQVNEVARWNEEVREYEEENRKQSLNTNLADEPQS